MKAVVYHGAYNVRMEDRPLPSLDEGEVLIKVAYTGICGSDVSIYMGKHPRAVPPVIIGHEFSGEVVDLMAPGSGLNVGDRVAVEPLFNCGVCYACEDGAYNSCVNLKMPGHNTDGSFAEYAKAPANRVHKLPEGLSMEIGATVEPTSVAVHAVRRSRLKLGDRAVVLGAGPIGLLVAQAARLTTELPITLVEVSDWRLELARRLGFDVVDAKQEDIRQAILDRTGGRGAAVVFDAAGAAPLTEQVSTFVKVRGQIVMVAMPKEPRPVDLGIFAFKQAEMVGCRAFTSGDCRAAIAMMAEKKIDVAPLITHTMPLEQFHEGLEIAKKAESSMKILLKP
ncbi:MAG: zinc-dependent alcohol dehydrogenase [Sphingomonadaceae bacterium]